MATTSGETSGTDALIARELRMGQVAAVNGRVKRTEAVLKAVAADWKVDRIARAMDADRGVVRAVIAAAEKKRGQAAKEPKS